MADPFGYLMNSFQTPQYGNSGYGVVSPGMQYLWEFIPKPHKYRYYNDYFR